MTTELYDDLVRSSPQGSVFASSWWLDAVAGSAWRPHLLEEDGAALAAWPTVVRRTRLGDVHAGSPLAPFLGPLFAPEEDRRKRRSLEGRSLERLLGLLEPFAHLEARCHPAFDYWTPLQWHGFTQTTGYTWRLEDLSDLEAVERGLRDNIRGDIRKARREGIEVSGGTLAELLAVQAETLARRGVARRASDEALARADAAAAARDARTILLARDGEGRVHAGAYLVHDERTTYYLLAGSDTELRRSGAASLVVREAIAEAARRGTAFDFEGSMLRPVERFVRAFGGEPAPYSIVRRTPSRAIRAARAVGSLRR